MRGREEGESPTTGGRRQHGVTLVEYALVVTFLVAGSAVAVDYLTTGIGDEVDNQAECVETRPPPVGCQLQVATTSTTTTIAPGSTTTTVAPTSTTLCVDVPDDPPCPTTTTTPPPPDITWGSPGWTNTGQNINSVSVAVSATSGGTPRANVVIRISFQITQPPPPQAPQTQSCTTNAAGTCTVQYPVPFSGVTQIVYTYDSANPPAGSAPTGSVTVDP